MAESFDDGEFWLPSKFLADDAVSMEKIVLPDSFGCFSVSSESNSPVDSVFSSTETESDEDEFFAGLTRRLAHSTSGKGRFVCDSPQSTLSAVGSGCSQGSSRGSPNGPSRVSSPPGTWDLLHAAAGEVARMNLKENKDGLLPPTTRPFPVPNPAPPANHFRSVHQLRQPQRTQQPVTNQFAGAWRGQYQQNQPIRNMGLSPSAWPTLKQTQHRSPGPANLTGSGMRAVFLPTPEFKRESTGTGVFLPRPQSVNRKKSGPTGIGCSTVLLPAKVVQALNLNVNEIGLKKPQIKSRSNEQVAMKQMRPGSNNGMNQNRRYLRPAAVTNEIRLPVEWTY